MNVLPLPFGGRVKNETPGNLSHLPEPLIDMIRRSLQGKHFFPFEITSSLPQGPVQAVRSAMKRLDMASLPGSKRSRVVAMRTKRRCTRQWIGCSRSGVDPEEAFFLPGI